MTVKVDLIELTKIYKGANEPSVDGITMSIGLAFSTHDSARFQASPLIEDADKCLYAAKDAGRNCTRYPTV